MKPETKTILFFIVMFAALIFFSDLAPCQVVLPVDTDNRKTVEITWYSENENVNTEFYIMPSGETEFRRYAVSDTRRIRYAAMNHDFEFYLVDCKDGLRSDESEIISVIFSDDYVPGDTTEPEPPLVGFSALPDWFEGSEIYINTYRSAGVTYSGNDLVMDLNSFIWEMFNPVVLANHKIEIMCEGDFKIVWGEYKEEATGQSGEYQTFSGDHVWNKVFNSSEMWFAIFARNDQAKISEIHIINTDMRLDLGPQDINVFYRD